MRTQHLLPAIVLVVLIWAPALAGVPQVQHEPLVWVPVQAPGPSLEAGRGPRRLPDVPVRSLLRAQPHVAVRPRVVLPANPPRVVERVQPPPPTASKGLRGNASWYCWPSYPSACPKGYSGGMYAAAGPKLRAAICGDQASDCWRGRTVFVNGRAVKLVDWCQCYWRRANEKLIDLFHDAWVATGAQHGVTITW